MSLDDFKTSPIFLQWKGTDACIDLNCECGKHSHVDDMFCYYVECPHCGAVYELSPHPEVRKLPPGEQPRCTPRKGDAGDEDSDELN